ncbi:hypothetical protein LO763_28605, partial [Glycomyces sp. A-F 0318]|uniref:hypothetical protein n=1 Tax=Glycomyces amatae TaxID=2881355 RepID=UPI001E514308
AVITHHDHQSDNSESDDAGCGCSDWRTDADLDTEHQSSGWDLFPTGLYRTEWSPTLKPDLDGHAAIIEHERARAAMRAARAKARARFTTRTTNSGDTTDQSDSSGQATAAMPTPPAAPTAEAEASSPREPALAGTTTTARTVR